MEDKRIGEECGIFGIYDPNGDCARTTYYGLYALQHRGQESCGIAVNNHRDIAYYKGMGLVNEVFDEERLEKLEGNMAIGHVRYSTTGESLRENAQPLVLRYVKGNIALAHNGNLVNKQYLEQIRIAKDVMHSCHVSPEIRRLVKGLMIESYIEDGAQKVGDGCYGKSITDPCLGWEKTEKLIYELAELW